MRRTLIGLVLLLACACGSPPAQREDGDPIVYKGHPIDCLETKDRGSQSYAFSCDFVGWHQTWDLPCPTTTPGCTVTTVPEPRPTPSPSRASRTRPIAPKKAAPAATSDGLNWPVLRECENSGRYTSPPGTHYRGAYQFDTETWRSVGGTGDPADAPPAEQDHRAQLLYKARGRSPWPVCGRLL